MSKRWLVVALLIIAIFSVKNLWGDEQKLNELYRSYGQLQIQAEIIAGQTQQVKAQIAQELQKPVEKVVEKK